MSEAKFPHAVAACIAENLKALLAMHCERIVIAGSLRRGRPMVSDIELLYVPKMESVREDMFEEKLVPATDDLLNTWLASGVLSKRKNVNGSEMWGPQNKLSVHCASGIPVDLFSTTQENWFTALVIRTGSKVTNLKLTAGAQRLGRKLRSYGAGVEANGEVVRCTSEEMVFRLCGVPYREPRYR